jgi:hypothetical protein
MCQVSSGGEPNPTAPEMAAHDGKRENLSSPRASDCYGNLTRRVSVTGTRCACPRGSAPARQRVTQSSLKVVLAAGWVISIFRKVK